MAKMTTAMTTITAPSITNAWFSNAAILMPAIEAEEEALTIGCSMVVEIGSMMLEIGSMVFEIGSMVVESGSMVVVHGSMVPWLHGSMVALSMRALLTISVVFVVVVVVAVVVLGVG